MTGKTEYLSYKRSRSPGEAEIRKDVKLYICVHYKFKELYLRARINICDMFIKYKKNGAFLRE